MRFQCPLCSGIVAADNSALGMQVLCGHCSKAIQVPATRVAPGSVIADFIIQKELGRGGMGVVYLAHQISLDRPSALKVLSENYANDAQFVGNFIKEARAAAKLNHPHIVQAYAVGEDEGVFYFAMEDIDGKTMKEVLKEQQIIPSDQALLIVQQIAEALDYAWREQKLIHRDIKPDNIMLTNSGRAKLSDLGLASVAGEIDESNEDEIMGTPQYISPEHLTGSPMDVRSDIYSLGATFYHFVTGQFPYQGRTAMEIAQQHLSGTLTPPHEINPSVPAKVSAIIMKMMARTPAARYQNTGLLIDDIRKARHAVDGVTATIQLPPPGTAAQTKKTGGLRLAAPTSGKQLTLKKAGGSTTATNLSIPGVSKASRKKKGKTNKKLIFGISAGAAVLLIAGAVIALLMLGGKEKTEQTAQVVKNAPPPPSALQTALSEFNRKASTAINKQELLPACEDFLLQKSESMSPVEQQEYDKVVVFYNAVEEIGLKKARESAVEAYKAKIRAEEQKIAEEILAERRRKEEEARQRAAALAAQRQKEKEAAELKAKRDTAKTTLDNLKKSTAGKIVEACKGRNPAENLTAVTSALKECLENPYKTEEDPEIQPQAAELVTWAEGLQKSFENGHRIDVLLEGKDKELDDLEVPSPGKGKKKLTMQYRNKVGIIIQNVPMKKFMEIRKNRSYIPVIIAAVAEKIEATDDLWAYKMLTNEKRMPEDFDSAKISELKNIAGIAEETADAEEAEEEE